MKSKAMLFIIIGLAAAVLVIGGIAIWQLLTTPDETPPDEESSSQEEVESSEPVEESEPGESEPGDEESDSSSEESSEPDSSSSEPSLPEVNLPVPGASIPGLTGAQPTVVSNLTIDTSGTNGTTETCRNLYIEASPVTVKNKTVQGDLIIKASAGDGDIILENIDVTGNIFVSGGGKVTLKNVTAKGMVADGSSGEQTLALSGQTRIPDLWAKNDITLDESGLDGASGVDNIYSQKGADDLNDITLKGARITNVSTSTPTNLTVPADSSVQRVAANAQTHLAGPGSVRTLEVGDDDVTYDTKPAQVTSAGNYSATESAGAIGSDKYGISNADAVQYPSGKLPAPTELEIYVTGNSVYCSFTGDRNAKSGYTVTPIIDSIRQREITVDGAGTGNPPKHTDVFLLDSANSLRGRRVSFEVYANAVDKKFDKSSPARSSTELVYETADFLPTTLSVTKDQRNGQYSINWDQVEFVSSGNNVVRPSNTNYYVDYTVSRAGGQTLYQATNRASTTRTSYKIPVMPDNLESGSTINVTLHAEVDTDRYPCVIQSELLVQNSFQLGDLPAPTGLSASLPSDNYGLNTVWSAVEGAGGYTVTARIHYGATVKEVSQSVTSPSHNFTGLITSADADSVTGLSFAVAANAPAGGICSDSQPAELSSVISVPIKLPAPAKSGMAIELLPGTSSSFNARWGSVIHAEKYDVYSTHYGDPFFRSDVVSQPAASGTDQVHKFDDPIGGTVNSLTFTAKAIAHPESWFRDSDEQESDGFAATISLQAPSASEMYIVLSPDQKDYFTANWSAVDNAWGYLVVPIYNGAAQMNYAQTLQGRTKTSHTFNFTDAPPPSGLTSIAFRLYALAQPGTWYSDSEFTDSSAVQVNQLMPTPTNLSIELTDNNSRAIVRWNSVEGAKSYDLTYYVEAPKDSFDVKTVTVDFVSTARTEYTINNLDPDLVYSVAAEIATNPKSGSWNESSPLSARVTAVVATTKLSMPVSPSFVRGSGGALTVSWSKGSVYSTARDQFRIWRDLPDGDEPTADNGHAMTADAFTIDSSATGTRTHHVMIQAVPKVEEYNREPSEVLDFYMLNLGVPLFTNDGMWLPALGGSNDFASDPVVRITSYIISGSNENKRIFAFNYDGTANTLIGRSSLSADWNAVTGAMHLELETSSGKVYHTQTIAKGVILQ